MVVLQRQQELSSPIAAGMNHSMRMTLTDNTFGTIGRDVLSNNSYTTVNVYPSPATPSNPLSCHGRGYMPAGTILFGREPDLDFIIEHLVWEPESTGSKRARFALLGPGGMGKTSVALKVMRDARLLALYSEYDQAWFPCFQATSFPLLLDTIRSALNITSDTKNPLNDILNHLCSSKPIILLFDNFETPWNAVGARAEVAQLLRDLDAIPHVAIFLTMRASIAPCEEISWTKMRIEPLDPEAAYLLYTEIDAKARDDEKLFQLLEMLGHMPLAVKLMARQGKSTGCTVEELMKSYRTIGTAMLGPSEGSDTQNSVSISISMSIDSPQIQREHHASELLTRISMLPAGTTFQALQTLWAADIPSFQTALQALLEASLLECRNLTYFVLPVIRSHMLDLVRFSSRTRNSMVEAACSFLKHHSSVEPGRPTYKADTAARAFEEINLQSILLETSSTKTEFIEALLILAWHQSYTRPRTEVIEHAVKLATNATDQSLVGRVLDCYGWILYDLNRLEDALHQLKLARQTHLVSPEPRLAALTLLNIAVVSASIDPNTNDIHLTEQARLELEASHTLKSHRHQRLLGSLSSSFRTRFRKDVSLRPKDEAPPLNPEDMAKCLQRLGRAYSRNYRHSEAIEHLIKARGLCSNLSLEGAQCAYNLAMAYHRLPDYDEAERWGLLALNEWKETGDSVDHILRTLGMIYISKGQYDQAIECLKETLDTAKAHDYQWDAATGLLELGRAQMKKGEIEDARASFTEALTHFSRLKGASGTTVLSRFYLAKLEDPSRIPTEEERYALLISWHAEDIPPSLAKSCTHF